MTKLKDVIRGYKFILSKSVVVNGQEKHVYSYGTPGALLRQNILHEWRKYMVSHQENTFEIDPPIISPGSQDSAYKLASTGENEEVTSNSHMTGSLRKELLANFVHNLESANRRLPFSQAAVGICFENTTDVESAQSTSEEALFRRELHHTHLVHHHYSPPGNVYQVFDQWLTFRLRWWRQFSNKPSNFISSNCDGDNGGVKSFIEYLFPWGKEIVETVCHHGNTDIIQLEKDTRVNHKVKVGRKIVYPNIIESQTSLEAAMSAFLADACQHKQVYSTNKNIKQNEDRTILQLHPHLAPYNVALVLTGSKGRELRLVATQWAQELKEASLRVLDVGDTNLKQDAQFKRNDELGIPYTVILNDQTLDTGHVSIRHRDTTLREQAHITKFKQKLLKYNTPV